MGSVNRVGTWRGPVDAALGPPRRTLPGVRDVVISISIVRQQLRVLGLVVDLANLAAKISYRFCGSPRSSARGDTEHRQRVTAPLLEQRP